jgi:small subunit ribosomal protein S21
MIKIEVLGKMSIESALKKYRAKYIKIGISKELFMRKEFKKKSVRRRDEIARAVYRESIKSDQN